VRVVLAILLAAAPAAADPGAFCEVTPCVPGPVARRTLTKNEPANGVLCKGGDDLGTDSQGHVVFCTTARAVDIDGLAVAAGAYTLFHASGRIYQTHVRAKLTRTLATGTKVACGIDLVVLGDDGTLRFCKLDGPIAASPRPRVGDSIAFHANGGFAAYTLDEPATLAGLALAAGARAAWDDLGRFTGGYTRDPVSVGGFAIRGDFAVYPNGKLHAVELDAPATVQGHPFERDAKLAFRDDGTLERADHVIRHGFMIHGEPWSDTQHDTFDPSGKVISSTVEHWQSEVRHPKYDKP
jgi:hypothetical protein